MAGDHHHGPLREDPAYIKYANMSTNRFRFFRWTPRNARFTFVAVAVIPGMILTLAYATEGKYQLRGKRRGDVASEY